MVRAKFRVMEISRLFNGSCTIVRLLPVMARNGAWKDDPTASEENASFWHATPSGEAKLTFPTLGRLHGFGLDEPDVGELVYIDMQPHAEGEWQFRERRQTESQLDIVLAQSWSNEVKMSILNQGAWQAFAGKLGDKWDVTFRKAK